jgi:threonine dehydrogenase-like Zn-dependent dehydrogenase
VYRGQFPQGLVDPVDPHSSGLTYPLKYGYANVGRVEAVGNEVDPVWLDRVVFSCQPHGRHYLASIDVLHPLTEGCDLESACFLANMETGVNLVQDAAPILGENVAVLGQGIVGLLTTALLAEFPLNRLMTADLFQIRREASLALGVSASLDPEEGDFIDKVHSVVPDGADVTVEISGSPDALNDAVAITKFGGRIVVGSWYGERKAELDLGGKFHRSRIQLIASQVSTIAAPLLGRWDKQRRLDTAWAALERIRPEQWVTHRFKLEEAATAYALIDKSPQDCIQVLLIYD